MELILLNLTGYLLGSIPFGVILARYKNIDLRQHGSGNIGATNVARTLGKRAGLLTLAGDAVKGVVAVALADHFLANPQQVALVGFLAFIGHLHSVFLKFRGGKGVATGLGIFLYLMPWATLCSMAVFGLTLRVWRFVSLSSMIAAISIPVFGWVFSSPPAFAALGLCVAALVVLRHRENIDRLRKGTENRIGSKAVAGTQ